MNNKNKSGAIPGTICAKSGDQHLRRQLPCSYQRARPSTKRRRKREHVLRANGLAPLNCCRFASTVLHFVPLLRLL